MILTIVVKEGLVCKNGICYSSLNMQGAPLGVHAVQWDTSTGWVEFEANSDGTHNPNSNLSELPSWVNDCLSEWDTADVAAKASVALTYSEKRAAEYPPMQDYLDGIVKNDQSQINAYIFACQNVKAKYPKV